MFSRTLRNDSMIVILSLLLFLISGCSKEATSNNLNMQESAHIVDMTEHITYDIEGEDIDKHANTELISEHTRDDEIVQDQSIDRLIREYAASNEFSGIVLVSNQDEILFHKGYGMKDHENGIPITNSTQFFIASITKNFTAVAIMQLYEKGLIDLEDPITKYLQDCSGWQNIRIKHLLLHTSGLDRFDELPYECGNSLPDFDMIKRISEEPLKSKPGVVSNYSNLGYYLLGIVIEEASGLSYAEYMEANIFSRLGMKDTACALDIEANDNCAQPYETDKDMFKNSTLLPIYKLYSAGSIYTTAYDMYLYDRALSSGILLEKSSYEYISTVYEANGSRFIPCMGATDNLACSFERYVDRDLTITILSNMEIMPMIEFKDKLTAKVLNSYDTAK